MKEHTWLKRLAGRVKFVSSLPSTQQQVEVVNVSEAPCRAFEEGVHYYPVDLHLHTNVLHVSTRLYDVAQCLRRDVETLLTTQQLLTWPCHAHLVMLLRLRDDNSVDEVLQQLLIDNQDILLTTWCDTPPVSVGKTTHGTDRM